MGYAHYWTMPDIVSLDAKFEVIEHATNLLADGSLFIEEGSDPARFYLQGGEGNGYETFTALAFEPGWGFCKTNMKGYDTYVCEMLIVLRHWVKGFKFSSDGIGPSGWGENWEKAAHQASRFDDSLTLELALGYLEEVRQLDREWEEQNA